MRTRYKNYLLELDFTKVGDRVPTKIIDTGMNFTDVQQAKNWIEQHPKEEGDDNNEK